MSEATTTPPMLHGITPYLTVRGASEAAGFYERALGAEVLVRMPHEDGKRLMHCHMRINGADVMMADDFPDYGMGMAEGGPSGVTLHLAVDDADRWFARATEAGMTVVQPLRDEFWGDRYGQVRDPYGHTWAIASPIKTG